MVKIRSGAPLVAGLAMVLAACGVSNDTYQAAVAESETFKRNLADETQRVKDCEQKVADLTTQNQALMQAHDATATQAMTAQQRNADLQALNASLAADVAEGKLQIAELAGLVTIRLQEKVLFPTGSATLHKAGKEELKRLVAAFRGVQGRLFRVEGHTDDLPIRTARFPSNWELSTARALAVVHFVMSQGVEGKYLAAAGYGKFHPIVPNDSPAHRAQNRRIDISVAPMPSELPRM